MADGVKTMSAVVPVSAIPAGTKLTLEQYQARLREAFARALSVEDLTAIARKLIEQAREGDKTASRLVLKYGLGNVTSAGLKNSEKAASRAAIPTAPPSSEDTMALIHRRLAEQAALEAEIRSQGAASRPPQAGPARSGR